MAETEKQQKVQDPSVPPAHGTCHLFQLPGELRNRIYELALHVPGGLFCQYVKEDEKQCFKMYASLEAATSANGVEVNQMKYVSRQFHFETASLDLKANDAIIFTRTDPLGPHANAQFMQFLAACSDIQKSRLRRIELTETAELRDESRRKLVGAVVEGRYSGKKSKHYKGSRAFCTAYPKTIVYAPTYCDTTRGQTYVGKFISGAMFKMHYRNADYSKVIRIPTLLSRMREKVEKKRERDGRFQELENFRYRMPDPTFVEEDFREEWRKVAKLFQVPEEEIEEYVKGLLGVFREWVERGL
ncbi:hypothetical protein K458DRAFT_396774 [Lentithecium fluviatile CBS 122367]|uniref:Uncharacterized protein n=1 Tax=Lentithecium fluviatile CBS 122367 TaxID=1168545 RepID=A0A6G1IF58_9PLEO|nr:hypothetical protein K458DRAFT_396774 [Lentithecium fluviatile CBS 122367]